MLTVSEDEFIKFTNIYDLLVYKKIQTNPEDYLLSFSLPIRGVLHSLPLPKARTSSAAKQAP